MSAVPSGSVQLVVTSPPYPMIEMWDNVFFNPEIKRSFENKQYYVAYGLMHEELKAIWKECYRVLCDGGIACINIGDACRTLDKNFNYFANHATITEQCVEMGFQCLPLICWRKPSNKPNKFMGSGMLPPSAYATLEQEYILIFRKGSKRIIEDVENRRKSAYFWEERNMWFSDSWEKILGVKQAVNKDKVRERNAAYPTEIPLRLIQMFSMYGDTVLDPFWGTGTTTVAAMLTGRNAIGYELNPEFEKIFNERVGNIVEMSKQHNQHRVEEHKTFIATREGLGKEIKHTNLNYGFKVMTSQ